MKYLFIFLFLYLTMSLSGCHSRVLKQEEMHEYNRLAKSSSPYLLQHAKNPVDWYPWGPEALEKAKREDKPILVSIGYSSCHWCHVMERESFENDSIADIMNKHFVNIKVDREERPDIDQIYMDAVQTMGINGGWPLNVFLTPDQKPFYGGTYFPPQRWIKLIATISKAFVEDRNELNKTAAEIAKSLSTSELVKYGMTEEEKIFKKSTLTKAYSLIQSHFDTTRGGLNKAPKFPMPTNWLFLLRYYELTKDKTALDQFILTMDQIAYGGIHDHIGGGFARYSTDMNWFAPHFEKMLYDNGQLMSLYAEAYVVTGKERYKEIIANMFRWLTREMTSEHGAFFSAIDADSEGEEGKFYVWKKEELENILGEDYSLVARYYNVNESGNWEHQNNILYKTIEDEQFAREIPVSISILNEVINRSNEKLLKARNQRDRPGLDYKVITGWNALMITGLVDAFLATDNQEYLETALKNGRFILEKMYKDNILFRIYNGETATIDGYLEDHALVIQAFIGLYEATFDEKWLQSAQSIMSLTLDKFYDPGEKMFYFTSEDADLLIARKKEIFDNVIPSSNSQMALNLYKLGIMLDTEKYVEIAKSMLGRVSPLIRKEPLYLTTWMTLYTYLSKPTVEIIMVGDNIEKYRGQLHKHYIPNKIVMGAKVESSLPLFQYRTPIGDKTTLFVCYNKTCKLPVFSVEEALKQIE